MSEQMRQLAKLFENWVANFKIIEYKCQNTSEIDKIYTAQKNFDFKSLATFWSEKCQNECFEMNHPLHQEIKTKAVASFYDGGIYNFVLMMDENERYPWLIIQYTHCINAFVVPNYCYVLYEAWQGSMFGAMSFLRKQILQNKDELCFKDVEFGFILSNARPAHYFCHILAPLVSLDTKEKTFCTKNSFFFPKKPKSKEKLAFFYPTCLWNYNLTRVYDVVALQSLQDLNTLVSNEDKIDKFDTSELSSLQIINSKNLELSL